MAIRRGPRGPSSTSSGDTGKAARTASSRSPLPRPCSAETANGSPRPRFHSRAASASARWSSTLLAARITGLPERRRIFTTVSSASVIPTPVSTTNSTASASDTATSAWSEICSAMPRASGSQPPVSTTVNRRPFHEASYDTRSRVTPGTSSTTASRRPIIRLTRVDLPTLGRPTTASTGTGPVGSSVPEMMLSSDVMVAAASLVNGWSGLPLVDVSLRPGPGHRVEPHRCTEHRIDSRASFRHRIHRPPVGTCPKTRHGDHRSARHEPQAGTRERASSTIRAMTSSSVRSVVSSSTASSAAASGAVARDES